MTTHEGYIIKPHKLHPTSYIVVTEGQGGKIPSVLSTLFTSVGRAKQAINLYNEAKAQVKERSNASKARATSGD